MLKLNKKSVYSLMIAACVGFGAAAVMLFAPGRGSGPLSAAAPAPAAGGAFHPTPVPPVSLPAQANIGGLVKGQNLTAGQAQELTNQAPDLTPPANAPDDWAPGSALMHNARVLMTNVGTADRTIFAYPTTKGRVCAVLTGYSSGCLDGFRDKFADIGFTFGDGIVWGLVPDSVKGVDVVVDGVARSARLDNNAYFFEGGPVQQLVAHFADGSTKTVSIPASATAASAK